MKASIIVTPTPTERARSMTRELIDGLAMETWEDSTSALGSANVIAKPTMNPAIRRMIRLRRFIRADPSFSPTGTRAMSIPKRKIEMPMISIAAAIKKLG